MPDQVGVLQGRPMNGWIDESLTRPKPRSHCRGLIVEGENTVVFASSNVGKSIFCIQCAEEIARHTGKEVDYIDCERARCIRRQHTISAQRRHRYRLR